jgi:hypothetical protein
MYLPKPLFAIRTSYVRSLPLARETNPPASPACTRSWASAAGTRAWSAAESWPWAAAVVRRSARPAWNATAGTLRNCGQFCNPTHCPLKASFGGSATPCASPPPPRPTIFSYYSFWIHHPVNRDDRHLLAHAMASVFSVIWEASF